MWYICGYMKYVCVMYVVCVRSMCVVCGLCVCVMYVVSGIYMCECSSVSVTWTGLRGDNWSRCENKCRRVSGCTWLGSVAGQCVYPLSVYECACHLSVCGWSACSR